MLVSTFSIKSLTMKKTSLILFTIIIFSASAANAQKSKTENSSDYTTAIGLKFYPTGITFKHFVSDKHALEGIAYFYNYGARITGLYEIYGIINNAGGLKYYYGPGVHLGLYNSKYGGHTSFGVDGVLGLDYKINSAPIDLSVDWQPSFEFGKNYNNGFSGGFGGVAIRYTF